MDLRRLRYFVIAAEESNFPRASLQPGANPSAICSRIATHPGVLECVVIGVVDAHSGEAVRAFIVKKDPNVTSEDIIKFCGTQLISYNVPKRIEFRISLPKTSEPRCQKQMPERSCAANYAMKMWPV